MQVQIKQSFRVAGSPRPLLPEELVTVDDALALEWITEGKAVQFIGATSVAPIFEPTTRRRREKAVKV